MKQFIISKKLLLFVIGRRYGKYHAYCVHSGMSIRKAAFNFLHSTLYRKIYLELESLYKIFKTFLKIIKIYIIRNCLPKHMLHLAIRQNLIIE